MPKMIKTNVKVVHHDEKENDTGTRFESVIVYSI